MKSISDTLEKIKEIFDGFSRFSGIKGYLSLIGGYAVILHGVERTTTDIDLCFHTLASVPRPGRHLYQYIHQYHSERFQSRYIEASRDLSDPLRHDVIFLDDRKEEYPRIDILLAQYKWEAEGLIHSDFIEGLPVPVLPKPYLIAMKLRAGGKKDELDIMELLKTMSNSEIELTKKIAKRAGRDKNLADLINETALRPLTTGGEDIPEELLSS
ncbi:MAG: hypothetical protein AB1797_01205 [bacterium]